MRYGYLCVITMCAILAACAARKEGEHPAPVPQAFPPSEPASPSPSSVEYFNAVVGNTVYFVYDRYELNADAQAILRGQAAWLKQNLSRTVTIEGHADERGTRDYNFGLSERRAESVKRYLVSLGVAAGRIKTIPYGKERPICVASAESCWSRNRRAVSAIE